MRFSVTILGLLLVGPALAADWGADPEQSSLAFTARQQDADFQGEFEAFTANISFDPATPDDTRISAVIQLGSVETQNNDRDTTLATPEWFDLVNWPESTYTATSATAANDGWIAAGELALKGVTLPVELAFQFTEDDEGASFTGTAVLRRLDFNVGTGDWTDTRWVGNEVKVDVDLRLVPGGQTP
jgi:polyisoprenoid-binding protein YceI